MRGLPPCVLIFLAGCSPGPAGGPVTGTVLQGGKPLTFVRDPGRPGSAGLLVTILALDAGGKVVESHGCKFDPATGTFRSAGLGGKGVPVGRYRVSLHKDMGKEDEFNREFGRDTSPLVVDLPGTGADLVIDLDARTVTVK